VFRLLRRLAILVLTAIALFVLMPAGTRPLPALAGIAPGVRGVMHIHTARSDGTGSIADVTAAAARAGLMFVIVTDHGDATREPDLPDYRNGVLYIDGVEISTNNGHLVALGLPKAPYPLRGHARDVLEDIARLGGFAIVAHPGSAKPDLQWTEWDAPFAGLEWLNADSEWRDERWWTLARGLITYPFRPPQSLALLLDRPVPVMQRWDTLTQRRRVVAVAGVDAHARVGVRTVGEPYDSGGSSLHFPSYLNSFREFSITVGDVRLTGDAATDAQSLLAGIRAGHVYSTIDALAGPAALRFTATSGSRTGSMGDALPLGGPVTVRVDAQAPPDAQITLFRNGMPSATGTGPMLQHDEAAEAAVYRVEVALPRSPGNPPVPWLVSNPVYVGRSADDEPSAPVRTQPRDSELLYDGGPGRGWTVEKSAASDGAIDTANTLVGSELLLRFALSGVPSDNPYAAFVMPATGTMATHDRLVFTARADRPMRMSVQLRAPTGGEGERWQRSVYLDQTPRTIQIFFDEFTPLGSSGAAPPALANVQSVLFVVDTVNTKIGSNGQIWIDDIKYEK
jgi:hypothetical protein